MRLARHWHDDITCDKLQHIIATWIATKYDEMWCSVTIWIATKYGLVSRQTCDITCDINKTKESIMRKKLGVNVNIERGFGITSFLHIPLILPVCPSRSAPPGLVVWGWEYKIILFPHNQNVLSSPQ